MNLLKSARVQWLLWLVALGFLIALALLPVSYRITRMASLGLGCAVWFGLIGLLWRPRWVQMALLGVTLASAGFLLLPSRGTLPMETLRSDYISGLRQYEGVTYYWGGESARGIDCSGLIRRGLIDALLCHGIRTFDAGSVRRAISLWWHDCTAKALGQQHQNLTVKIREAPSLNALDHTGILPGDLAVTRNGVHIMAYLGGQSWIEADPDVGKVITVMAPSESNGWFRMPVNIVRWSVLSPSGPQ